MYNFNVVTGFFPLNTAEKVLRDYVKSVLHAEPDPESVFLFCNKAKKGMHFLYWSGAYDTRLYPNKKISCWPEQKGTVREITADEFHQIFDELIDAFEKSTLGNIAETDTTVKQTVLDLKQSA
jgi:hypothetical protein